MSNSPQDYASQYDSMPWIKSWAPHVVNRFDELPFKNLAEMTHTTCKTYSNRPAYTVCLDNGFHATLSFSEIEKLSDCFASYLVNELKLKKGDRVAIQLPNCLAYPVCVFGIFKAGCILVNVNPLYTESESTHQLNDAGVQVLVTIDVFGAKLPKIISQTKLKAVVITSIADFFPPLKSFLIRTVMRLKKMLPPIDVAHTTLPNALSKGRSIHAPSQIFAGFNETTLDDVAALQYTGGTTGVSKGAVLTHRNLLSNVSQILNFGRSKILPNQETIITALPLYHIFAFTINNLLFFYMGGQNILIPNPRPLKNMKPAFDKFKITWMTGVNTLFNGLTLEDWFLANPPRSIKISGGGGAAVHTATIQKWEEIVGSPLIEGFGLTESSPVLMFNPIDGRAKPGTIGLPLPGTKIRIVDDNGVCVKPGERGELIASGPQIMRGYWQRDDETQNTIKDGWLYTGDVATMDEEGYFKIVDRKKEMILVSGFNVYPNEIEDCIAKHPKVREVGVIGVPDDKTGEAVAAYIAPKDQSLTAEEIKQHCRANLVNYKVPKIVEFKAELPKTPIGKILRKDLRAEVLSKNKA